MLKVYGKTESLDLINYSWHISMLW